MRIVLAVGWLIVPVLAWAWHAGPGQQYVKLDEANVFVANAKDALELYLAEYQSKDAYGFDADTEAGLGDEGRCDDGDVTLPPGDRLYESICLWRAGTLVLAAGGPIDPAALRPIAEGMDARAAGG